MKYKMMPLALIIFGVGMAYWAYQDAGSRLWPTTISPQRTPDRSRGRAKNIPQKSPEPEKPAVFREAGFGPPAIRLGFDGTLSGSGIDNTYAPRDQEAYTFMNGKHHQALLIDHGNLQFVGLGGAATLFAHAYTANFWFMLPDILPHRADYIGIVRSKLFTLDVRHAKKCILFMHGAQGGHFQIDLTDGNTYPVAGIWYHLAIVYEHATNAYRFYLNGRAVGRRQAPFKMSVTMDVLTFGDTHGPREGNSRVALDEFNVYGYARSETQIAQDAQVARKATPQKVTGRITFAGRPITEITDQTPRFWFRNEGTYQQQPAEVSYNAGQFVIQGLPPGKYGVDVRLRIGKGYASHLTAWKTFMVDENLPFAEIEVPMSRILHLISPQDNDNGLAHWSANCTDKAAFPSPVRFAWEPLLEGTEYYYEIGTYCCEPFKKKGRMVQGHTRESRIDLPLAVSADGEIYLFRLWAQWGDYTIAHLETYGKTGGRGWDYRFRVTGKRELNPE